MTNIIKIFFLLYSTYIIPHAITNGYETWRRLGDNILTVCKTEYFSHEFNLPYYYTPFAYYDSFVFKTKANALTPEIKNSFKKMIFVTSVKDIANNVKSIDPILFVCTYLSATPSIIEYVKKNPLFEDKIHDLFTPYQMINTIPKSSNQMVIAVHVRKGGGFDWPLASRQEFALEIPLVKNKELYLYKKNISMSCNDIWPLRCLPGPAFIAETKHLAFKKSCYADYIWAIKFPPDQYYIEQIKIIIKLMNLKSLTIKLFTDDPHPEDIVMRYKNALKDQEANITFDYRKSENHHDKNVIEDLFAIAQCDGIISACSSFAFAAMILGNHSIMIYPEHAITMQDKVIIDKVKVIRVENTRDSHKKTLQSSTLAINLF